MKKLIKQALMPLLIALCLSSVCCADTEQETALSPGIYLNDHIIELTTDGSTELDLLSVENGINIQVVKEDDEQITINGETVEDALYLDITSITRDDVIEIEITDDEETISHTINLMPASFGDYTTEGASVTAGDYYMSTYDEETNFIFKLDNLGNLVFYKKTGDNALDFRKEYNSNGEVRYTYLQYLETSFCGIAGINPGCVVVMDEDYHVIDELYYQTADGGETKIDPHGFIYLDDGHYILTAYEDTVVEEIPEELGAEDNSAYLAVLYIQEIKDGEVLWEFCSQDYPEFFSATTEVTWNSSLESCYDYVHFNSMYIDQDGSLLVSCRNINSILKISRETGSLIWTLGGTEDDFELTEDQIFSKQHSIIVTEDGSYMIFNNANDEVASGAVASSSIIRLKVDENTMEVIEYLEYETEFYSTYMGAIRELDGENGIYLWSVGGNYTEVPEYSMIEYSETDGALFKFRFNEGNRRLYCANKCE